MIYLAWTSPVPEDSLNRVENNVPSDHRNTTNEQLGSISMIKIYSYFR